MIDGLEQLLDKLPAWVQEVIEYDTHGIEEVAMDLGQPLVARRHGKSAQHERTVKKEDLSYIVNRLGGFREDNRAGIEGTVHRISAMRDRYDEIIGVTVRIGRFFEGLAEPLRPMLEEDPSLLIVGRPGTGKTTLLRDVVRIVAERVSAQCLVVDTSNEIGGDGQIKHPKLGAARRQQIPSPRRQADIMMQTVGNKSPKVVVIDEIGVYGDIPVIVTVRNRGASLIASAHGEHLLDVFENPVLYPILGDYNPETRKRLRRPTFNRLLEIRARGVFFLYPNLAETIDALAQGQEPKGYLLEDCGERGEIDLVMEFLATPAVVQP